MRELGKDSHTVNDVNSANFTHALHREMPEILIEWCSAQQISRDIEERLKIELDRCEDMSFAESFAAACPVEGCEPEDYLQRVVTTGSGQQLLTGIRFHGGLGFPFVDLIAATQPLDDTQSMEDALETIRAEYAPFEPHAVRLLRAADRPLVLPDGTEASVDQHVVVGPIEELATRPKLTSQDNVRLAPVDDAEQAARFVASAYEAFIAEQPAFDSVVFPADDTDLRQCQEAGVSSYITVDGVRAGLLATREELGPLVRGQAVIEEVLIAEFRGRGIAPVAQSLLVEQLAKNSSGELICGTIDDRNHASRATARRVGRRELAAWHWIKWD